MSLSMRPLGHIDLFFALEIAEKRGCVIPTGALSEPEASRMGGVEGPPHFAEQRGTSCEENHPASIPKYGGFSAPQDEKAVLLRSK